MKLLTGRLLVATPTLLDPNFRRSIVLMLDHDDDGSLGVIINRPTEVPVSRVLSSWQPLVTDPDVIFSGGPVSTNSAVAVAAVPKTLGEDPLGWKRLYERTGLIDLDTPPELLAGALAGLRIFVGYAGWSPGQLEAEIDDNSWYVLETEPNDLFTTSPDALWRSVLSRQGGEVRFVATLPDDPSAN